MTWSPSASPSVTSHRSPRARSSSSSRVSTLPSLPTTRAVAFPFASRVMPCWGARTAFSFTPSSTIARTNMPGSSVYSGLGNTIRRTTEPVVESTVTSRNWSAPSWG